MPGRIALRIIPAIAAIASAVSVICVSPIVNVRPSENPSPHTNITPAIIRLRDLVRSTLFSTTFLTPIADIIPYSINDTPPMIAVGIVDIIAENLGINESITANTAAILITAGS